MLSMRSLTVRVGSWHCVPPCRAWLRPFWGRVSLCAWGWVDASRCSDCVPLPSIGTAPACQLSQLSSELLTATCWDWAPPTPSSGRTSALACANVSQMRPVALRVGLPPARNWSTTVRLTVWVPCPVSEPTPWALESVPWGTSEALWIGSSAGA